MTGAARRVGTALQRIWQVVLLFAVLRIAIGVAFLVMAGRNDTAWGVRATIIAALAAAVCFLVAMMVRRWSPPRRAN